MTLRLDKTDARLVHKFTDFENESISDFVRDAEFECIEDREDLATLHKAMEEDDGARFSHAQVLEKLDLDHRRTCER